MPPPIMMSPIRKACSLRGATPLLKPRHALTLYKPQITTVAHVIYGVGHDDKSILRQRILAILDDISNDIMKMYEELKPLETNVDIDMTCYLDPETNEVVCKGA